MRPSTPPTLPEISSDDSALETVSPQKSAAIARVSALVAAAALALSSAACSGSAQARANTAGDADADARLNGNQEQAASDEADGEVTDETKEERSSGADESEDDGEDDGDSTEEASEEALNRVVVWNNSDGQHEISSGDVTEVSLQELKGNGSENILFSALTPYTLEILDADSSFRIVTLDRRPALQFRPSEDELFVGKTFRVVVARNGKPFTFYLKIAE